MQAKAYFLPFLVSVILTHHASTAVVQPSAAQLVDIICKQTSDYRFCVNTFNADSRTPTADQLTLAYIAVSSATKSAEGTEAFIAQQLQTAPPNVRTRLQKCGKDYDTAVQKFHQAYTDLDSETLFDLADYADAASQAVDDCQSAIRGTPQESSLTGRVRELKGLSEIVAATGKTGIDGTRISPCLKEQLRILDD